jgi:hypothetical protein
VFATFDGSLTISNSPEALLRRSLIWFTLLVLHDAAAALTFSVLVRWFWSANILFVLAP